MPVFRQTYSRRVSKVAVQAQIRPGDGCALIVVDLGAGRRHTHADNALVVPGLQFPQIALDIHRAKPQRHKGEPAKTGCHFRIGGIHVLNVDIGRPVIIALELFQRICSGNRGVPAVQAEFYRFRVSESGKKRKFLLSGIAIFSASI